MLALLAVILLTKFSRRNRREELVTHDVAGGRHWSLVVVVGSGLQRLDGHPLDRQQRQQVRAAGAPVRGGGGGGGGDVVVVAREDVRRQGAVRQPQTEAAAVHATAAEATPRE